MDQQFKYDSLDSFKNQYDQLCQENMKCQNTKCELIHPRCFSGLCIKYLQNNGKKCENDNCQLYHYTKQNFKKEFNIEPINGIYRFNICNQKCSNKDACYFQHVSWANKVCVQCLIDECEEEDDHDNLSHITWSELKKKVYIEFNINNITPENLCLCQEQNCMYNLPNLDDVCSLFFKGVCPNLICSKKHIYWEYFKLNGSKFKGRTIQSCIQINKQITIQYQPSQIFLQEVELLRLRKDVKEKSKIDIIFIMDCTGSMIHWIQQCQSKIYTIIEEFRKAIQQVFTIRVGFVGYRDYTQARNIKQFECHDLTCDIKSVIEFISQIKAQGGEDEAEDVVGGIEKAYQLNISSNAQTILITFLFTDAPNHGIQYHDEEVEDLHKDDIKAGTLENLMQKYRQLKERNFFYCISMSETTDQMYKIMQKNFDGLTISQANDPGQFKGVVEFHLKASLTKSQSIKEKQEKNQKTIQASYQKPKSIPYRQEHLQSEKRDYWKSFRNEIKNYLRKGRTSLILYEERLKFDNNESEGVTCYVYRLMDTKNMRQMLMKIPKQVVEEFTKNNQFSQKTMDEYKEFLESRFDSLIIAKQLAMIYRTRSQGISGAPPIYYVSPILYTLDEPFMGLTEIYAETYIDKPYIKWQKYSNNQYYIKSEFYYLTSFSHFTFEETGRLLIVTDLQGISNVLSDPSIQSNENFIKDDNNYETHGIADFLYALHSQCNIICQQLGLCQQEEKNLERSSLQIGHQKHIFFICDLCDEFQDISYEQYLSIGPTIKCQTCQELEQLEDVFKCQCCRNQYKAKFALLDRMGTLVDKCNDCKNHCQKLNNKCIYCDIECNIKVAVQNFNGSSQFICSDAKKYMVALQCKRCYNRYDFSQVIRLDMYNNGYYLCKNCQG